jgi:tetratricopeptide (TPR) repeat protein
MSRNDGTAAPRLADLQAYLQQDPDNWSLRAEVFDVALASGERDVARAQVEYALKARPGDAGWRHRQALLLLSGAHHAEAQAVLEALVAEGHDDPFILHNLAYALFAQRRYQAAVDILGPLLDGPDDSAATVWVLWLRCQHRLYRLDEALQAFVARASQRAVSPEGWGVASLMALDASRLDDARAWSERALKGRGDQLEALAARGSVALAEQDVKGALGLFERALRVNPSDGRSWSGLAFTRMLQMDLPSALEAFGKAVSTMPDHIGTWIGFGWCRFLSRQPEAARQAFEQALQLDRNFGESHGALAVALARLGQTERAKTEIEVALRLDPKSLSARYAQAMLSGEADDPAAFLRLSRRVLAHVPAPKTGNVERTVADVVFKDRK